MAQARPNKKHKQSSETAPDASHRPALSLAFPAPAHSADFTYEMAYTLACMIARASIAFNVSEVVIYDDPPARQASSISANGALLARLLQALETPPCLRPALLPKHDDFRLVKAAPLPGAPHHTSEWGPFREGVVLRSEADKGSYVDIGLDKMALVPQALPVNLRVTVRIGERREYKYNTDFKETMVMTQLAPSSAPRAELGLAWGYTVRLAAGLSQAVKQAPFKGGYDLVVGTSSEGVPSSGDLPLPASIDHVLLVLAPRTGFENCVERDPDLAHIGQIEDLVNLHVDLCPGAGPLLPEDWALLGLARLRTELTRGQEEEAD